MKINNDIASKIFIFLIIGILGVSIYSNTFHSSFQFDDEDVIVRNLAIRNLGDLRGIWNEYNTRFIVGLTFALNYSLGGLDVFGYHLFNIWIHVITSIFVFCFVKALF